MAAISLECAASECVSGPGGVKYSTPELDPALAIQMLQMHVDLTHKQNDDHS